MVGSVNRRKFERIAVSKQIEMKTPNGTQNGEIRDISLGGAAIVSGGSLEIRLGTPVELRVENFEKVSGYVVRASGNNDFAIAFDIDEDAAEQVFAKLRQDT